MEIEQLLAVDVSQGFTRADGEAAGGMTRSGQRILHSPRTPVVLLQILLKFRVYRVDLAFGVVLGEERGDEELGEAVDGAGKGVVIDLKVVVGVVRIGIGVVIATILGQIGAVIVDARILVGAQDEHVLQIVMRAREIPHLHPIRCARFARVYGAGQCKSPHGQRRAVPGRRPWRHGRGRPSPAWR